MLNVDIVPYNENSVIPRDIKNMTGRSWSPAMRSFTFESCLRILRAQSEIERQYHIEKHNKFFRENPECYF